jgi:hypothetical protein
MKHTYLILSKRHPGRYKMIMINVRERIHTYTRIISCIFFSPSCKCDRMSNVTGNVMMRIEPRMTHNRHGVRHDIYRTCDGIAHDLICCSKQSAGEPRH